MPDALPSLLPASGGGRGEEEEHHNSRMLSPQQVFLGEPDFFKALGFCSNDEAGSRLLFKDRLSSIEEWAKQAQLHAKPEDCNEDGVHVIAARVAQKAFVVGEILLQAKMEVTYRECLRVAPDFGYPLDLIPKGPSTLLVALFVFLAKRKGYKRVGEEFYVPVFSSSASGESMYFKPVPINQLLTLVFRFEQTPNLCTLMWSSRTSGDMERMLRDENHWPSLKPSKRYLGFRNVVYDLVENVTLSWEKARVDPNVMPFNCLEDEEFPLDLLEEAKQTCPEIRVGGGGEEEKQVHFVAKGRPFVPTPLFDQPLRDQGFGDEVIHWYQALFGRMFHGVGKTDGDNWEICVSSQGAPGTFKSSSVSILQSYVQPSQYGVIATKTEKRFPIAALEGKLMVFLTETGGCDLDKELLKQMTSGDPVTVAVKFQTASTLSEWGVPVWMCGNRFLDCTDPDGSLQRRFAIFPYTRILPPGKGDTGLVKRIIKTEQTRILIKCNTLYLAMKRAIREPIHPLLPSLIRRATSEALMQNDSLRSYLVKEHVISPGDVNAHLAWPVMWENYVRWCNQTGQRAYPADPYTPEIQTMVRKMGVRFRFHQGTMWLVYLRPRTAEDPPFDSVFTVRTMNGNHDDDELVWEEEEEEN
jgi:hypothetical protein